MQCERQPEVPCELEPRHVEAAAVAGNDAPRKAGGRNEDPERNDECAKRLDSQMLSRPGHAAALVGAAAAGLGAVLAMMRLMLLRWRPFIRSLLWLGRESPQDPRHFRRRAPKIETGDTARNFGMIMTNPAP